MAFLAVGSAKQQLPACFGVRGPKQTQIQAGLVWGARLLLEELQPKEIYAVAPTEGSKPPATSGLPHPKMSLQGGGKEMYRFALDLC